MRTPLGAVVVGAVLVGQLVGGQPALGQPAPAAAPVLGAARVRVRIVEFGFRPRRVKVAPGTRVRWVNTGGLSHTTTSTTGEWDSGILAPGESFSRVFRKEGTFRYRCQIHPALMRGVVVVG